MKITRNIPDEIVHGLLCCAFEGGVGYWLQIRDYHFPTGVTKRDFAEGGKHTVKNWEDILHVVVPMTKECSMECGELSADESGFDGPVHMLNRAKIERGLQVMADKYPRHFANAMDPSLSDAETGDVLLQCCLLGELTYG